MSERLASIFSIDNELRGLAKTKGFSFVNGDADSNISSFLQKARSELEKRTYRDPLDQIKLFNSVQRVKSQSETSGEAIARAYDTEYGNDAAPYGYASAILSPKGFEMIVGVPEQSAEGLTIIDVGAGSNEFLRFCRDTLKIPPNQLYGSDVSKESKNIIESDGFTGYCGRLEELNLPRQFDVAYLSYFIDYDTNQSATFEAAINIIKPGGKIVLEGLFPVRPFGLLSKDVKKYSFVTKGKSAKEDIELVANSFTELGKEKGRTVSLEKVVKTHRFVNSHYGFFRLPSFFLTFSVSD